MKRMASKPMASSPWRAVLGLSMALGTVGCAHAPGPEEVASAYARALEEERLTQAAAWTTVSDEERPAFLQHYADPQVREELSTQFAC